MITVLVHYKQIVEAAHPLLDDEVEIRSKVVEVENLTKLNAMFRFITLIQVINPILSNKELKALGFTIESKVFPDELNTAFNYQVAKIETSNSLIEVINEYDGEAFKQQHCNVEITEDGKPVDQDTLIKLIAFIK